MTMEQAILAVLSCAIGIIGAFVAYWVNKKDLQISKVERDVVAIRLDVATNYVRKDDCRETHGDIKDRLAAMDKKLDRLIERVNQ